MNKKNYWCYRINKTLGKFFFDELNDGRLRQGWGWDNDQDLRNLKMDEGAGRNRPMFNLVKKGDILLVPQLPDWGSVAIVEATADWKDGYDFNIHPEYGDYGHIFPAKYLKKFTRRNEHVSGNIRSTLKNPSRFWNINHYEADVEQLVKAEVEKLSQVQDYKSRMESSIGNAFSETFNAKLFSDKLFEKMVNQFNGAEWEYALVAGLEKLLPSSYNIVHVGGHNEQYHGADILIRIPGIIPGTTYGIAIQVKDHSGFIHNQVIDQINKAEAHWQEADGLKIIDKIVIVTKASKEHNLNLQNNSDGVKFIFAEGLKELLVEIANQHIRINQGS
ncbi:MAG TPA: hypothetical protein VGE26_04840 [Sphingobacteriaceae bacterium]